MPDAHEKARDSLVERIFQAVLGFNDLHMIYVGDRLGLYAAIAERGPQRSAELAEATSTSERYVREWLEQQAVTGLLDVDRTDGDPGERRYSLPAGYADVLVNRDDPAYLAAFARMQIGMVRALPSVLEAFGGGAGVPYAEYDRDFLEGQGDMNRVNFVNLLASEWLPAVPDVHARLQAEPPARVADIACGTGWSTIALARAYPSVEVEGFDLDPASIESARRNAEAEGLGERIRFELRDAGDPSLAGRYDLVLVFEAVHDMSRPVDALRVMRGLAAERGTVIVADERVADSFTAPGDEIERLMYGWSVLHCLPVGLAEQPSAATGTVMRASTFERYAREAGFERVEVLPIENDFWRFYRLYP